MWITRLVASTVGALLVALAAAAPVPTSAASSSADQPTFDGLIAKAQKEMMADPVAALRDAQLAGKLAELHPNEPRFAQSLASSLWLSAEALTRVNRVGDARMAAARASRLLGPDAGRTKLGGNLALTKARIAESSGDIASALGSYQRAHSIFVALRYPRGESVALQGIGSIYDKAHDFETESRYYRDAAQVYSADPALALSAANNRGFALQQMSHYGAALQDYRRALKIAAELKSGFLEAQILTNIAAVEAKLHRLPEAERAADRALRLLGKKDEIGGTPFVWGIKAEIDYDKGNLKRATADLAIAFRGINLTTTITPFRDMHEIAYRVYRAQGNFPLALAHLEAFKRLDDQGRSLASSANLAVTTAKFDFTRQQLEIEHLRSTQLQRDISLRRSQATTQTTIFSAFVLAGVFFIAWIAWRHSLLEKHRNAIAEKNVELTDTLAERNVEIGRRIETESQLRFAMEAAQQANRAKSHFLANMSHELRTPLNAIIGFSEMLLGGYVKLDQYSSYVSNIAEGARHLLSILNEMLDMARIEAGKLTLDNSDVDLARVVEHAIDVLGCKKRPDRKQIRFEAPNLQFMVKADELRLRQVTINLITNAIKFTDEEGIIQVSLKHVADGVDLIVEDDGVGIPSDKLETILEPFGQAESAYARSHGGVGLGLPIVKSLLELHGGRFTITSAPGRTIATAHLPADRIIRPHNSSLRGASHTDMVNANMPVLAAC